MNMTDTGTAYSDVAIVENRNMATIIKAIENVWICRHGAPKAVSADDEYNRRPLRTYLETHDVLLRPRPTRRHNKLGIVERRNGTVKAIIAKLNDESTSTDTTAETIITRASFYPTYSPATDC